MKPNYRRCVSCGKVAAKTSFCRVVRIHHNHEVNLDTGMGRSAYICPQADCLQTATTKKRLGRALKIKVPEHIYQNLQERLAKKC